MSLGAWLVRLSLLAAVALPLPASAAFHLMEIERVIGGVDGDTSAQAVQLRMRFAGQNLLAGSAQLVVRDAAGANPVVLSTFPAPNPTSGACLRILLATAGMEGKTNPPLTSTARDYLMAPIPASYMAAGSLTFETLGGSATWVRLSWGGNAYTGSDTLVSVVGGGNDDNGNAAPEFPGALPSFGTHSVNFTPACATTQTNNAAQYVETATAAVFTNNDGASFTVLGQGPPQVPVLPGSSRLMLIAALGALGLLAALVVARRRVA